MKANEVTDCSICPLKENDLCNGGFRMGYHGNMVEPPCTSWGDNEDLDDYVKRAKGTEKSEARRERREAINSLKKEEEKAKRAYMSSALWWERKKVKDIKSKIRKLEDECVKIECHISAVEFANTLVHEDNNGNTEWLKQLHKKIQGEIKKLNDDLIAQNDVIKEKKSEIHCSKGYILEGRPKKPDWKIAKGKYWYENIIPSLSVKSLILMEDCMDELERLGASRNSCMVWVKRDLVFNLEAYSDGKEENLGYIECYGSDADEKVFRDFLRSILKDTNGKVEVIVMPSFGKKKFFGFFPACYEKEEIFRKALVERFLECTKEGN